MKVRRAIFNLIRDDDQNNLAASIFDGFIITLIVANVVLVVLDTFDSFSSPTRNVFHYLEVFSVGVFSIEYFLRVWTSDHLRPNEPRAIAYLKYVASPIAIIDLFAILPFYLPFIFPMDLRVLRIVRLLRLLRLLKVNHYTKALSTVGGVIKRKATQLLSSMLVVLILMVIASMLMYSIEHDAQPDVFQNAFSGFWWAVATLTTVGYGDIYPVTIFGKVLGAIIALLGIGLVAVPTGIISAGFVENITYEKEVENDLKHFCPYCGKNIDAQ